jgi:hypothetical protein
MTGKRLTSDTLQRSIARIRLAEIASELYPDVPLSKLNLPEPTQADRIHKNQAEASGSPLPYLEFVPRGDGTHKSRGLDTRRHIYTDDLADPAYKDVRDGYEGPQLGKAISAGPYSMFNIIAEFNPMYESIEDAVNRIIEEVLRPRLKQALERQVDVLKEAGEELGQEARVAKFFAEREFHEQDAYTRAVLFQAGCSLKKIAECAGISRSAVTKQVKGVLNIAGIPFVPHSPGRPKATPYHNIKLCGK